MADPVEAHSLHEVWSSGELLGPDAANERDLALQRGVIAASEVMARLLAALEPGNGDLWSYATMAVMVLRVESTYLPRDLAAIGVHIRLAAIRERTVILFL